MTSALPFARGTLDSMPLAREVVEPMDLLRRGPEALAAVTAPGSAASGTPRVTGVSAFLIDGAGMIAVVVAGPMSEPLPVRRPGGRGGADADTPFATIPADGDLPVAGPGTFPAAGSIDEGVPAGRTGGSPARADRADADQIGDLRLWRPTAEEALRLAGPDGALLMGRTVDGVVHVAVRVSDPVEVAGVTWANIRWCGHLLPDDDSALALQAVALVRWHAQSGFCGRCGHAVATTSAGWTTTCPQCGTIEYPRQDPAVIMAVIDRRDRVLMAHNAAWRAGFWSVLAGFVEAGESPDRAVRREVLEEVGLQVGEVRYFAAQPWPMPRSLMLGYLARVEPGASVDPRPDGVEIDRARFFSRDELAHAITSGEVEPPGPTAIARFLLEEWYGGPLPESPRRIDPLRRS